MGFDGCAFNAQSQASFKMFAKDGKGSLAAIVGAGNENQPFKATFAKLDRCFVNGPEPPLRFNPAFVPVDFHKGRTDLAGFPKAGGKGFALAMGQGVGIQSI